MRKRSSLGSLLCCTLGIGLLPAAPAARASEAGSSDPGFQLELRVETPVDGALIGDPGGTVFVAGSTLAQRGVLSRFDIVFVVDQSHSTIDPSGGDVNGDGRTERWSCNHVPALLGMIGTYVGLCGETPDSVLSAEVHAVRTLVGQLDPRTTRIGVVAFSGDDRSSTPDAIVMCPLTTDYEQVESALDDIAEAGPQGQTNFYDAIQVAATEMLRGGLPAGADSGAPQQIVMFLSDGQPTAPYEDSLGANRRLAVQAASTAAHFGLRIDTYGIGPDALSDPVVLAEMARVSNGIFTPVAEPSELQSIFEKMSFVELKTLRVRNRTTDQEAAYVRLGADGTFSALLEAAPGSNTIEISAHASDGSEQTQLLRVEFLADGPAQPLPQHLLGQRNLMLANHLLDLRSRSVAIEAERDAELRRRLEIQMDERQAEAERLREVRVRAERDSAESTSP